MPKIDTTVNQIESIIERTIKINQQMKAQLTQDNKVLEKARQSIRYLRQELQNEKDGSN